MGDSVIVVTMSQKVQDIKDIIVSNGGKVMNRRMIGYIIGKMMGVEALVLLLTLH